MRLRPAAALLLAGLLFAPAAALATGAPPLADPESTNAVPRAHCGPGSLPETGVQGQVPRRDRDSGRSTQGYRCNLSLVGQYQGTGATWVQPSYSHCSYLGSFFPTTLLKSAGVQVVDASDQQHPRLSATLGSTAMALGTWESLKVHEGRGLLAATGVPIPPGIGALAFDIYDIGTDCAHPRLLNGVAGQLTMSTPVLGHEASFSPDGRTYYAITATGQVTAIDVADPAHPRVIFVGTVGPSSHGVSFSPDGRTMYGVTAVPAGVQILDVGDIQDRKPVPRIRQIGSVNWADGLFSQHTIPFTSGGHPWLYAIDEAGGGGVRLLDIADPTHPRVVREYRLEINQPSNKALAGADTGGDGAFGYDAHYCTIDRPTEPTMLACGYFQSGVRLFDVRDPMRPAELGYYNPPAQVGKERQLTNSAHAAAVYAPNVLDPNTFGVQTVVDSLSPEMNTDWCSSPPEFRPGNTLWVTCQDNGFMILRYTPYRRATTTTPSPSPTPTTTPTGAATASASAADGPLELPTSVPSGLAGPSPWSRAWPWFAAAGGLLVALGVAARRALR